MTDAPIRRRGFNSMSPERLKEVAALGGASKKRDPETRVFKPGSIDAQEAGRKGGLARRNRLTPPE